MTVWMVMTWHAASTDPLHYSICDANEREQQIYCVYAPLAAECSLLRLTCSRRNTHKVCSKFSKQLYGHLYENSCHKFVCTYGKDNSTENNAHTPKSTHLQLQSCLPLSVTVSSEEEIVAFILFRAPVWEAPPPESAACCCRSLVCSSVATICGKQKRKSGKVRGQRAGLRKCG